MRDPKTESSSAIDKVPSLNREGLLALWTELFDTTPPSHMSQVFLRRFLAFELQSRHVEPLPKSVTAGLTRFARQGARAPETKLRPGGRYLREWNGVTHVVDVIEDGYRWQGETFSSLSAIARAITGTRWSGPRFFGPLKPRGHAAQANSSGGRSA